MNARRRIFPLALAVALLPLSAFADSPRPRRSRMVSDGDLSRERVEELMTLHRAMVERGAWPTGWSDVAANYHTPATRKVLQELALTSPDAWRRALAVKSQ